MAELRTMAQDLTKNSGDIENYSKEFIELQSQLQQIKNESFNGISLFSSGANGSGAATANRPNLDGAVNALTASINGTALSNFDRYGRTLYTHPGGQSANGSVSLNVVNLEYLLEVGTLDAARYGAVWGDAAGANAATGVNLGNVGGAVDNVVAATNGINTDGFVSSILGVSMAQFTAAIERLADVRAENGAEQNRILNSIELLQTNVTNLEAAHGRIMDADIALESTRFARHNVLVQAGAAMTAQANQLTNIALALIG
jgi:flagellin-like hook-associated protein FlgL